MANRIFQPGVAFGAAAAGYGEYTAQVFTAAQNVLVGVGWWLFKMGAHQKVQFTPDAGSTWVDFIAASGTGVIWSDGANVRMLDDGTTGTSNLAQILGA